MNPNDSRKSGPEEDTRGFLKNHHKKIYYVCRLFANNYKQHRELFAGILSAASQSMQNKKAKKEKHVLFLRACINMAALHSISAGLSATEKEEGLYKSPDYQKCMTRFREAIEGISDYEKMQLFLHSENVIPGEIVSTTAPPARESKKTREKRSRHFIPFIMEKLIWS